MYDQKSMSSVRATVNAIILGRNAGLIFDNKGFINVEFYMNLALGNLTKGLVYGPRCLEILNKRKLSKLNCIVTDSKEIKVNIESVSIDNLRGKENWTTRNWTV